MKFGSRTGRWGEGEGRGSVQDCQHTITTGNYGENNKWFSLKMAKIQQPVHAHLPSL